MAQGVAILPSLVAKMLYIVQNQANECNSVGRMYREMNFIHAMLNFFFLAFSRAFHTISLVLLQTLNNIQYVFTIYKQTQHTRVRCMDEIHTVNRELYRQQNS